MKKKVNIQISGLGQEQVGCAKSLVNIVFSPHFDKAKNFCMDALVVPRISSRIPMSKVSYEHWKHLNNLMLADPEFHIPADIDILVGAELYYDLVQGVKKSDSIGMPVAIQSELGWLIGGGKGNFSNSDSVVRYLNVKEKLVSECPPRGLDDLLKRFWELETVPMASQILSLEEKLCVDHFKKTVKRDKKYGYFIVQYPFKYPTVKLGESLTIAIRRFNQVEKRVHKNEAYAQEYAKFMREYETLGHMIEVSEPTTASKFRCYLPHHFILKESSSSTKFRVVFDASAKTSNGKSLNDTMMIGPIPQDSLANLIMRFRKYKFVITADIEKMYRQIMMDPHDQELQHIVYRDSPDKPLRHFRLTTVTYGTAAGPSLATSVLRYLADEHNYPVASRVLKDDFYMDDLMSGADTEEEVIHLRRELTKLLDMAQFTIRKFTSNSEKVLQTIPEEFRETKSLLCLDKDSTIKALGIFWNPMDDTFGFKTDIFSKVTSASLTKRVILSEISRLFDPIGWLAPVIISAKILMQSIWKEKLDWDDIVPNRIATRWERFKNELNELQELKIPRAQLGHSGGNNIYYLVGFSDASESAYSASVYLAAYNEHGKGLSYLVASKTRVAPVKQQSLPRLELCGAHLLSEFMPSVAEALKMELKDMIAYTDSTLVLSWVRSEPYKYHTFVGNRIAKIQENIPPGKWGFVRGIDNPADCASRGITVHELIRHSLWWNGPSWLRESPISPSRPSMLSMEMESTTEKRPVAMCNVTVSVSNMSELFEKYSSLIKMQRVMAYVLRFKNNLKYSILFRTNASVTLRKEPWLCIDELNEALLCLIRIAQRNEFATEVVNLENQSEVNKKSKLLSLNPFLDKDGIIRVGGRLRHAQISMDQKYPIILPSHHVITTRIIENAHIVNLHAGSQAMLSFLQQRYWIIRGKDAIRQVTRKCVKCTRLKAEVMQQMMADLPSFRVNPAHPFTHCGVDYAGPFLIKPITPRSKVTLKAYIAVFICCVTRAIHLEVVSSASTEAFLAALRRFSSRRGKPSDMYSDQGTNFVGADNELKELVMLVKSEAHNNKVATTLSKEGITWNFNKPASPHHGGLWEAGVKSTKYHLRRIMGLTRVTFEELTTLTSQIEAILNSRPLTPESNNPSDLRALTPGHFLIGQALTSIPDPDLSSVPTNRLVRWQLVQQMLQLFWKRWSAEYITRLQQRPKWMTPKESIKLGSLVIIKEDNLPPLNWKLGRVTQLYTGADNKVRSVTVLTSSGELKRPIVKLCLLPIEQDNYNAQIQDLCE